MAPEKIKNPSIASLNVKLDGLLNIFNERMVKLDAINTIVIRTDERLDNVVKEFETCRAGNSEKIELLAKEGRKGRGDLYRALNALTDKTQERLENQRSEFNTKIEAMWGEIENLRGWRSGVQGEVVAVLAMLGLLGFVIEMVIRIFFE